jgi:ribosomal protein L35AE/L33A
MGEIIPTEADANDIIDDVFIGDEVVVKYRSHRSGDIETVRGMVIDFKKNRGGSKVIFKRNDGQVMWIDSVGKCYSKYSNYPYNGEAVEVDHER